MSVPVLVGVGVLTIVLGLLIVAAAIAAALWIFMDHDSKNR
jgi:hypothetical protein